MLRAAVERQCEITGEALAKLAKADEPVAARISDYRRIIAFRNILIHGYIDVDHRLVWDVVTTKVPILLAELSGNPPSKPGVAGSSPAGRAIS